MPLLAQEFRQSITSHRLHFSSVRTKLEIGRASCMEAVFVSENMNGVPLAHADRCGVFCMSNCLSSELSIGLRLPSGVQLASVHCLPSRFHAPPCAGVPAKHHESPTSFLFCEDQA